MINKKYNSIEDIDRDLEIYKLQAQIDREKLKHNFAVAKDSLSPTNLALDAGLVVVRKLLYGNIIKKLFSFKK